MTWLPQASGPLQGEHERRYFKKIVFRLEDFQHDPAMLCMPWVEIRRFRFAIAHLYIDQAEMFT